MMDENAVNVVYAAMHDMGTEYSNDHIGVLIGIFSDYAGAMLWMMQHGFSEEDAFGCLWKGRDRGWIERIEIDNPEALQYA